MTVISDFSGCNPFTIQAPAGQRLPFILNSPHSGRYYPDRFLAMSQLSADTIRRSEDCYVDELVYRGTMIGMPLLAANFPRAYLDVNREAWELDPRMFREPVQSFANTRSARVAGGLGTIPKLVGEGLNIYEGKLPLQEAIDRVNVLYKPYHAQLRSMLMETRARFGYAILIDCHSMPANIRGRETTTNPDFIVGDRFGTSCSPALTQFALSNLQEAGYTVAYNKPYAGGFITEHYGRPAQGLHVLQLEINRGLYMDEATYRKKPRFDGIVRDIGRFLESMGEIPFGYLDGSPIAAE